MAVLGGGGIGRAGLGGGDDCIRIWELKMSSSIRGRRVILNRGAVGGFDCNRLSRLTR